MKPNVRARRDLVAELAGIHLQRQALAADQRRREVDLDIEMEARVRRQLAPAVAVLDADRLENLDELARLRQLANADLVDRLDEGSGAAVHDRHFAGVDLDVAVVDAQAAQGGQQMLDRADGDAGVVAEHGAQREVLDVAHVGRDFGDDAAALADQETVAGVGFCRMQDHRNRRAAVDPRPGQLDLAPDRRLSRPDKSLGHCATSLGPLVGPGRPVVVGYPAPPVSQSPLRSPLVRLGPSHVAHRLAIAGFMNQTIRCCAERGQITVSYTVLPHRTHPYARAYCGI